ncbi:MAG: hypothetical protein PHI63_04795 [Patescibacteria group bacterium]|nr:hypothetical protein [Patescibacteria group bacterium]
MRRVYIIIALLAAWPVSAAVFSPQHIEDRVVQVLADGLASGTLGSGVSGPDFFKRSGNNVNLLNSSWQLGNESTKIFYGWFTNVRMNSSSTTAATTTSMAISGIAAGSCLQTGAGGVVTGTGAACSAGGGGGGYAEFVSVGGNQEFVSTTPATFPYGTKSEHATSSNTYFEDLDCSANDNQGALTVGADHKLICSNDDAAAGGGDGGYEFLTVGDNRQPTSTVPIALPNGVLASTTVILFDWLTVFNTATFKDLQATTSNTNFATNTTLATGDLSATGAVNLPADAIGDAEVVNTLTCSNYVRKSTWTDIDSYPVACTNQTVTGLGDTLTCNSVGAAYMASADFGGFTCNGTACTVDSDGTWTGHNSYPAACTNQVVTQIGDTNTCTTLNSAYLDMTANYAFTGLLSATDLRASMENATRTNTDYATVTKSLATADFSATGAINFPASGITNAMVSDILTADWDLLTHKPPTSSAPLGFNGLWELKYTGAVGPTSTNGISVPASSTITTLRSEILTVGTTANLPANSIDAITEIAAALKSGADGDLITGTAGSNGHCAQWNTDGDLITTGAACGGGSGGDPGAWQQGGSTFLTPTSSSLGIVLQGVSSTIPFLRVPNWLGASTTGIDSLTVFTGLNMDNGNITNYWDATPCQATEAIYDIADDGTFSCMTPTGGAVGDPGAWKTIWANAITPTSSSAGLWVLASSTFNSTLRVNGGITGNLTGNVTGNADTCTEVGTLTNTNLCANDGSAVQCTVNTEAEFETAMGGATNYIVATEIDTSSELAAIMTDEDGSGLCGAGLYCIGGHEHSWDNLLNKAATPTPLVLLVSDNRLGTAIASTTLTGLSRTYGTATTGQSVFVGAAAANDDDYLFFDGTGYEFLAWDDTPGEFDLSDDLNIAGYATTTFNLALGDSANNDDDYLFFDQFGAESLSWDDSPGEFDLSDDLNIAGGFQASGVSSSTATTTVGGGLKVYKLNQESSTTVLEFL